MRIDVRFNPSTTGTLVELEATIPAGGKDKGGTSFILVTPPWFGTWIGRRSSTGREPHDLARFALTVYYARPAAAARWLATAFGFESPNPLPEGEDPLSADESGVRWIEFHVGNCSLMIDVLAGPPVDHPQPTHVPWVFVDDLEAHLARAREMGATVTHDITSQGFTS